MDIKLKNKFFEQERDLQVLYRKLFFQMVIVAILYTVIGIAAYIGIRQILEHIEIFYSLVNWIEVNRVIGFFTYIIVGYITIYTQGTSLSIVVDTETGVNYLIHDTGITPLLDKNGTVITTEVNK